MCGFRVYPVAVVVELLDTAFVGNRMDFDVEVLVKLSWRGVPFVTVPVAVRYDPANPSHFHYLKDNLRISWMHTRLFFGMVIRLPQLIRQRSVQR